MTDVVTPFVTPPVAGYVGWWDASQITSPPADGGLLASWNDLSGNGHTLSSAGGLRPTYYSSTTANLINGLPAVWFNHGQVINGSIPVQAMPYTIAVVCKGTGYPDVNWNVVVSVINAWMDVNGTGSPRKWEFTASSTATTTLSADTTAAHAVIGIFNAASSNITLDGTTSSNVSPGTQSTNGIALGAGTTGGADGWTGAIGEVIYYPSALSGANITSLNTYLTTKWLGPGSVSGAGTGAIAFAGAGTATTTYGTSGTGAIAFAGSGTATASTVVSTSGAGAVAFAGAGTVTSAFPTSGTGAISFDGFGTATTAVSATGTGAVFFDGIGVANPPPTCIFTPPVANYVPPVPYMDEERGRGPAWRLHQYYQPSARGVNVFKLSDGTYPRDDVTGVWPTTPVVPNDALSSTWGVGALSPIIVPINPEVLFVYYGGHTYVVDQAEADRLIAAGYGDCVDCERQLGDGDFGFGRFGGF